MRSKRTKIKNKNELPPTPKKKPKTILKKQKNHKVKNAQKVIHDGIQFQSNLEKTMYSLLVNAGYLINKDFFYEADSATLIESFKIDNDIWVNKKSNKTYILESKTIRPTKYTPDFSETNDLKTSKWIIEVKGRPNESFPLRFKLFKMWLSKNNPNCVVYVPSSKTQCEETVKLILSSENSD